MVNVTETLSGMFTMNPEKENNRAIRFPILDPILMILRKRSVIGPIVSILIGILLLYVPSLESVHDELFFLFAFVLAFFVGGSQVALDIIKAFREEGVPKTEKTPQEQLTDLAEELGEQALQIALQNLRAKAKASG